MTKMFNDKAYKPYDEFTTKREAKAKAEQMRKKGYFARVAYVNWSSMYIVYVRKK